jgi:hypothetical protein
MICLRSGYCCIKLEVIIVDNPELGLTYENLIPKHTDEKCKHLIGDKPGFYSCAIHDYPWYKETPCYQYTQVEHKNSNCRMGEFVLKNKINL